MPFGLPAGAKDTGHSRIGPRQPLGGDAARGTGADHRIGHGEGVDEAGAHRLNVEGSGIAGTELVNAFAELNNPLDQAERYSEQDKKGKEGEREISPSDLEYLEAMEYGMPPACGWGYSERVFWIFEGVTAREGVPFPQLKADVDDTTKALYPEAML